MLQKTILLNLCLFTTSILVMEPYEKSITKNYTPLSLGTIDTLKNQPSSLKHLAYRRKGPHCLLTTLTNNGDLYIQSDSSSKFRTFGMRKITPKATAVEVIDAPNSLIAFGTVEEKIILMNDNYEKTLLQLPTLNSEKITSLSYNTENETLASCSSSTVLLWDITTGKCKSMLQRLPHDDSDYIKQIIWNPNTHNAECAWITNNGTVYRRDMREPNCTTLFDNNNPCINTSHLIDFNMSGTILCTKSTEEGFWIHNRVAGKIERFVNTRYESEGWTLCCIGENHVQTTINNQLYIHDLNATTSKDSFYPWYHLIYPGHLIEACSFDAHEQECILAGHAINITEPNLMLTLLTPGTHETQTKIFETLEEHPLREHPLFKNVDQKDILTILKSKKEH